MFNVKWDPDINGVILSTDLGDTNYPVRPVFHEELDLLKFYELGFKYPNCSEPLMWAAGRTYYYKGEKIALVKGGGFYNNLKIEKFVDSQEIEPINISKILKKNRDKIYFYSHDSIDFIRDCYVKYKNSVDAIAVSFSGGKDSVVLSDLVRRSINPKDFFLIFADTTLESQYTYNFIQQYMHENSNIKFITAKFYKSQIDTWQKFGPPSRINRWCHTVYKIAPIRKKIKEVIGIENPKVLIFDGIRYEESSRRSLYANLQDGTKNMLQMNISPIINWSCLEVFLYIFSRNLNFNKIYRCGYTRVGCMVCPYSSNWSEYLSGITHSELIKPYLDILKKNASFAGIMDINNYINQGGWKSRSGGMDLEFGGNRVGFSNFENQLEISLKNDSSDFWTWLQSLGAVTKSEKNGILNYDGKYIQIVEKKTKSGRKITISNTDNNIKLLNSLKRIGYKSEYCVYCQSCEAVCPTGALKINSNVIIDSKKCNHCEKCINYVEKGCWVAKSITYVGIQKVKKMTGKGFNRYQGFGFDKNWLLLFLQNKKWQNEKDSSLGNRQIMALKLWLKDSRLYENEQPTELGKKLMKIVNIDDLFLWSVIWSNLAEESPLIHWFITNINGSFTRQGLIKSLAEFRGQTEFNRTDENAINSLLATLKKTPLGEELNQGSESKKGYEKYYSKGIAIKVPDLAILYTIYQYSEKVQRKQLVVSEFIKNKDVTPYWIYGLDYNMIKTALTRLSSQYPNYIQVEFSGNLDNVNLNDKISLLEIIDEYLEMK
ncbi:phosphoadenosine phosphosulfate reductase [Methanolinea mesophila]|uniref:phosphoadenosine phosphosulfate reductase domain-containing protein n=1 Tax=Methanolinea mesophila TaxID=547055 RepID=UPI001AE47E52|nr:phosphoadenosine phosphosulfate reductase family protein [Methanolinea mesophila]MBP1928933.1 phosphoadenosine phosphosulfate reductase [Methanolinea mesophila]